MINHTEIAADPELNDEDRATAYVLESSALAVISDDIEEVREALAELIQLLIGIDGYQSLMEQVHRRE